MRKVINLCVPEQCNNKQYYIFMEHQCQPRAMGYKA